MEGALNNMGRDLLDGILESYYDEGVEEGMDKGNLERLLAYIKKKKVSIETALEDLDIPFVKREQYADYLKSALL